MDGLSLSNDLLFTHSLYFFCLIHSMPYRMELFRWNLLEIRVSSIPNRISQSLLCYSKSARSFNEAEKECRSQSGELVSPKGESHNEWINIITTPYVSLPYK